MKPSDPVRSLAALASCLALSLAFLPRPLPAQLLERVAAVPGQPPFDPSAWHLVANHLHSSTGIAQYKKAGVRRIFHLARRKGIRMVVVTDHNLVAHWFDPLFVETEGVIPVRGSEWTSQEGQANLVDFQVQDAMDTVVPCDWEFAPEPCVNGIDYQDMVREVHERDGLVILNHPRLAGHHWPADPFGADAVEVSANLTDTWGQQGREWWHRRLAEGSRLTGVGGSDWHYQVPGGSPQPPGHRPDQEHLLDPDAPGDAFDHDHDNGLAGEACATEAGVEQGWPKPAFAAHVNLVRMQTPGVPALREAIRAGHVLVQREPGAPGLFLGVDVDGDQRFEEVRAGDRVPAGDAPVRLQVRVLEGEGERLRVLVSFLEPGGRRHEEVHVHQVESQDAVFAFRLPRGAAGGSFLRAELGTRGLAVSNPVFF